MSATSLMNKITSLYLYGTLTPPANLVSDGLIRPVLSDNMYSSTLPVVSSDFMKNGAGRFATPYEFEVVQKFFDTGNTLATGSYSLSFVLSKLGLNSATEGVTSKIIDQKAFGEEGTLDYLERVYVFNNTSFSIKETANLKFVVAVDGTRSIENISIIPNDDNFDFFSLQGTTSVLNTAILPFIDPSNMIDGRLDNDDGLGRKVLIDFDNTAPTKDIYNASSYNIDKNFHFYYGNLPELALAHGLDFAGALNDFWDAGITKFLDGQNRPILYGTNGSDNLSTTNVSKIYSNGSAITGIGVNFIEDLDTYKNNGVVLIGGKGDDSLSGYGKNDLLIGGAGADKFNVVGKEMIQDATTEDRIYINGVEVTGGFKPLGFDVPIAVNETRGHLFEVLSGDITQPTGATLAVKYLWDNDAIAIIKDYTRPYLGVGDGNIEIYEYKHGTPTSLSDLIKAYNTAYNNTTNTTSTPGGSSAAAPSGADTNSANGSAEIYKPTVGTIGLRATIDGVFDTLSGAGALAKWQQFLPTLNGMKDYVLRTMPQTEDFFGNNTTTPINVVGMSDVQLLTDIVEQTYGRTLPLTLAQLTSGITSDADASKTLQPIIISGANQNITGTTGDTPFIITGSNATITDNKGSDTYIVDPNFGTLTIKDSTGSGYTNLIAAAYDNFNVQTDTIRFTHLNANNATITRDGNDLLIKENNTTNSVRVKDNFTHDSTATFFGGSADHAIEQVVFADGTTKTTVDIRKAITLAQQTDGNDFIKGSADPDLLHGQKGNDTLEGGDNGDMYKFKLGDGVDVIRDHQQDVFLDQGDTIKFGGGLSLDTAVISRVTINASGTAVLDAHGDDVMIDFGAGDKVIIDDQFYATTLGFGVFDAYSFVPQAISNNPLIQLGTVTQLPPEFDSTGYTNNSGITVVENTLTGGYDVTVADANYRYSVPPASQGTLKIPAPDDRIENLIFMDDGVTLSAEDFQQSIVERGKTNGNDLIVGFRQSETLDGGVGNDTLEGGDDGDTYLFNRGYGRDTINDSMTNVLMKAPDVIKFGEGITKDNIILNRALNSNDLTIKINGTTDVLTIKDQFDSSTLGLESFYSLNERIEFFQFADGTSWTSSDIQNKLLQHTAGNDLLQGFFWKDVLNGGAGNDTLMGGDMGDTYIFAKGYDNDVIDDVMSSVLFKDNDRLAFGPGIIKSDVSFNRSADHNDLVVTLNSTGDTMTIKNQFDYSVFGPESVFSINNAIEEFYFTDGSAYSYKDIWDILLQSTSGNDSLVGFFRNDTLDGGAENDWLEGGTMSDTYVFGAGYGNDTVYDVDSGITLENNDKIQFSNLALNAVTFAYGEDRDDVVVKIIATGETLTIKDQNVAYNVGGAPSLIEQFVFTDQILTSAQVRAAIISSASTSGNDSIYGSFGRDTLDGGAGNDRLEGAEGADTYIFGKGYGQDTIYEREDAVFLAGDDRILFDSSVSENEVTLGRNANRYDLVVKLSTGESITIQNHHQIFNVGAPPYEIATIEFANGTLWNTSYIRAKLLQSTTGNDTITGFYTNDTIIGGKGNDVLDGDEGADTYVYNMGDGNDTIQDRIVNIFFDKTDTIQFGAGITESSITLVKTTLASNDLSIRINGIQAMLIKDQFNSYSDIEQIAFSSGVVWNNEAILARLTGGSAGNDTLNGSTVTNTIAGGAGNDVLEFADSANLHYTQNLWGGVGDDTYIYTTGYGKTYINDIAGSDTLKFTGGITLANLTYEQDNNDMIIHVGNNATDVIRLQNYYTTDATNRIEFITVGSTTTALNALLTTSTNGNDNLLGTAGADILSGGAGNDTIDGAGGRDTLDGGIGNDRLIGGAPSLYEAVNDVYIFNMGYGNDTIFDVQQHISYSTLDTIQLGAGITPDAVTITRDNYDMILHISATDTLRVEKQFDSLGYNAVEVIQFADGTVWGLPEMRTRAQTTTSGNDIIGTYFRINDVVYAGAGDDTISVSSGDDKIYGEAGNDLIDYRTGGVYSGKDTLDGGAGNDTINGSAGSDIIDGGTGNDSLTGNLGFDTLNGGDGNDTLEGSTLDTDIYYGGSGNDLIKAEATGTIAEYVDGGTGDDTLTIASSGIALVLRLDLGTLNATSEYSGATISTSILNIEHATTGGGSDILTGTSANNNLASGSGNDTISSLDGNDSLDGGGGNDNLDGGAGNDTLLGGSGVDSLNGGTGNDVVDYRDQSGSWNINLTTDIAAYSTTSETLTSIEGVVGSRGNDIITGDTSGNMLFGFDGNDSLLGGDGNDTLMGGLGRDTINGGVGIDTADYSDSTFNWTISLTSGTALDNAGTTEAITAIEAIMGSLGNDTITGDANANILNGNAGNDILTGGAGADTMTGGAGTDIFRFTILADSPDATPDAIKDFASGIDKLMLSGLGFIAFDTDGGLTEAGELRLAYSTTTDRTYLRSDQIDFEVYLQGDYRTALTNSDVVW